MQTPASLLKIALDELRMQMLGAQVAFGFQFQALFQDRLKLSDIATRVAMSAGMAFMVLTLTFLIAGPAVHRIVNEGHASEWTRQLSSHLARLALMTLSVSLSTTVFAVVNAEFGERGAWIAGVTTAIVSMLAWQMWGMLLRSRAARASEGRMSEEHSSLHDRIDYVLTEARVILPGAQALLGFQLLAVLMKAFESLPPEAKLAHFCALSMVALTIVLLIAPAAIHRIAFDGADDETFERIGSRIVTCALVPLMLGIATESYVATSRLFESSSAAVWSACIALCVLGGFWFVLPFGLQRVGHRHATHKKNK